MFQRTRSGNLALRQALNGKDNLLAAIPSTPAVLQSLLNEINQPPDNVNLIRVARS